MKKSLFLSFLTIIISSTSLFTNQYPSAAQTYKELNAQAPFALSAGFAVSQTGDDRPNTAHPEETRKSLYKEATKQGPKARAYLADKEHIGYVLRALPPVSCQKCHKEFNPKYLDLKNDKPIISKLLDDVERNISSGTLKLQKCPDCDGQLVEQPRKLITLTAAHRNALAQQFAHLGVHQQTACTQHKLPTARISFDLSEFMHLGTDQISEEKLQEQAAFANSLSNPLVFCQHYTNLACNPDFCCKKDQQANERDIAWFAHCCGKISAAMPNMTYACPISQPVAFAHRVSRGSLPPFAIDISRKEFLANITKAQIAACDAMKKANPNLKVLISHQWKIFKPVHGYLDPRYALELLVSTIADKMYNGDFVNMLTPHQDKFDGIALSLYPALRFNMTTPVGENCAGVIDAESALETIMTIHKAFPTKDIFIVETGCNIKDPAKKKEFIDMTLHVCKLAREKGVSIKGVYLWSITNDENYYTEWNMLPGATNFSPYDKLDPADPCGSINAAGLYLKEILQP